MRVMKQVNLLKKTLLWSILMLMNVTFIYGGVLKGRIMDENRRPLPAAAVYVIGHETISTIADNEGYFTLAQIPNGVQDIRVVYLGFANELIQVSIQEDVTSELVVTMKPDEIMLEGVEVSGRISDRARALSIQKENIQVSNVVASDQVERFPDANIGDALKRLPSINVQYDQGEARFVNIRGTSAEYASVSINGNSMASAEGETRAAQFDLIPSDMIKTIEVNKVTTPDMEGDAIGGAVNLVTRGNPTGQDIFFSFGTGYNLISGKPTLKGSAIYANRFMDGKLGLTLSASAYDNPGGSDNHEVEWDYDDDDFDNDGDEDELFAKELQVRQYYVERLRQSYSAAIDYKFNANNKIEFKTIYNDRKDWENRYRIVSEWDDGEWAYTKEVKAGANDDKNARLEHQHIYDLSLKGEHQLGKMALTWKLSAEGAGEKRPQERYLAYKGKLDADEAILDNSNTKTPSLTAVDATVQEQIINFSSDFWEFDELTEEEQDTKELDYSAKVDFSIPLRSGEFKNKLKIGAKAKYKSKDRDNDFYEYEAIDENAFDALVYANLENQTRDGFMSGDYELGNFATKEFVGTLDLYDESVFEGEQKIEELAGNYEATELVSAAYLRFDQKIGNHWDLMAGVRAEQTHNEYSGWIYTEDKDADTESLDPTGNYTKDYWNVLPSVLARYRPISDFNLKAAYTQSLARPRYFDLVPFQIIEHDGGDDKIERGNPDLVATVSNNFDVMGEYFLPNIGVLSGGVFYKRISDIIIDQVTEDDEWDEIEQRINGGDASLLGFEVAYQQQLTFLPGVFKQMSAYLNYTYNQSEIANFEVEGREGEEGLSMPGTPEHTMNASLMYDNELLSVSVSYNMASSFIDEFGDNARLDRYYDQVAYLDFNLDWRLYQGLTFSASVNNILNQPLRYYQGDEDYTMQAEYYGPTFSCGLKYAF